jgi:hypothetical protein
MTPASQICGVRLSFFTADSGARPMVVKRAILVTRECGTPGSRKCFAATRRGRGETKRIAISPPAAPVTHGPATLNACKAHEILALSRRARNRRKTRARLALNRRRRFSVLRDYVNVCSNNGGKVGQHRERGDNGTAIA